MPQIRPITDLRNTNEISDICHARREPVFITKNGYGDLVVMSIETYEAMLENARAKRERIVAFKERSSMTKAEKAAMRAEERAKMTALMDALKKKGISLDDIIQELDKSED